MSEPIAEYKIPSPKLCFIGAGNMTKAIISGLIASGYDPKNIIASNPSVGKLRQLHEQLSIKITTDNCQAATDADIIVLAVKPNVVVKVCQQIASTIDKQLFISVAAGITSQNIKKWLQTDNTVVRAMPNTPCLLSKGAIGIHAGDDVTEDQRGYLKRIFQSIGKIIWIDKEQHMDIVTAVSGSGPAYYFYLTQGIIQAGIELGLSEQVSTDLANQTALGAAAMLNQQPQASAQALRKAVTSPNGTTQAATDTFDQLMMMQTIQKAVANATKRGTEMSKHDS